MFHICRAALVPLPPTRQTCLLEQTVGGCDSHPLLSTCCFQNKTASLLVLLWGVAELCDQRSESLTLSGTESTYKKPQWICVNVVIYTFVSIIYLFCRCNFRTGVPSRLLQQTGAEVDGPEQPGHRGDRAGPPPLPSRPPRLPKPHRHRCAQTRPHRLRSPQSQNRLLSGR